MCDCACGAFIACANTDCPNTDCPACRDEREQRLLDECPACGALSFREPGQLCAFCEDGIDAIEHRAAGVMS